MGGRSGRLLLGGGAVQIVRWHCSWVSFVAPNILANIENLFVCSHTVKSVFAGCHLAEGYGVPGWNKARRVEKEWGRMGPEGLKRGRVECGQMASGSGVTWVTELIHA